MTECTDCPPATEVIAQASNGQGNDSAATTSHETGIVGVAPPSAAAEYLHGDSAMQSSSLDTREKAQSTTATESDTCPPHLGTPSLIIEFCDRCRWYVLLCLPQLTIETPAVY